MRTARELNLSSPTTSRRSKEVMEKQCTCCQKIKDASYFSHITGCFKKFCDGCARRKREQYRENHRKKYPDSYKIKTKAYRQKFNQLNKEKHRNYIRQYRQNPLNRLISNLRTRVYEAIKNSRKSESTVNLLGCSVSYLRLWLEFQFQPGMSWENYGQWHVDHIKPCASFDLSKKEEQAKCFHYMNLQPLWALDNISKGAKIGKENDMKLEIEDVYLTDTLNSAASKLVGELCANLETISNPEELKKTVKNTIYQNFRDLTSQVRAFDCGVRFVKSQPHAAK